MANILSTDKQIAVISALAEGSSIRSIERMTGVHRDTVMRLGVKVGQRSAKILDQKMRDLSCHRLWGFVGKKQRRVREIEESKKIGDAWTFCALDAETKIVPCFKVGKRDAITANAFLLDLSSRMKNRVQVSTDGLRAYIEAIEQGFGADVDYAQIVKFYESDDGSQPERRYSPPRVVSIEKRNIVGNPDARHISTSFIERQNLTMRTHMRRLTRLTLGFSKKWENFEAAVALHFAYYNFCKIHKTLRCTPAMASGVEKSIWSVGDLVEITN
jgi:IS1 family transposase